MYPICYLENDDFDSSGNLLSYRNQAVMIMFQASWCHHCSQAKPQFQQFANLGLVKCATIQIDGERQSEQLLANKVDLIYPGTFTGYPSYLLILGDGTKIPYTAGRDVRSMKQFITSQSQLFS